MSDITHDPIGGGRIESRELEQEMRSSFLDYAMSVIVSRALPDVRDGLKPVHRRVLYAMHENGLQPTVRTRSRAATSSATVMGNYHPHGDAAIYDTLVRHGAAVLAALPARRRPGELRLDRRRPASRDEILRRVADTRIATPTGTPRIEDIVEDTTPDSRSRRRSRACSTASGGRVRRIEAVPFG